MRAILIGATGLVGADILRLLLEDGRFSEVRVFARRATGVVHPKLCEANVEFEKLPAWADQVQGDVLFSALGTTLRQAGSKEAQYRIDHDYQLEVARAARKNGVLRYVLVSSVGADASSRIFYLKMKGELEREVSRLGFEKACLLRPGPLKGKREHPRPNETISLSLLKFLPAIRALDRIRPIPGEKVARACIHAATGSGRGVFVYEPTQVFEAAEAFSSRL